MPHAQARMPLWEYSIQDGPDALPRGTTRTTTATPLRVVTTADTRLQDVVRAREVYRVHTQPHLYEEWYVAMVRDMRAEECARLDLCGWNCDTCHQAVMTNEPDDPCPNCWTVR